VSLSDHEYYRDNSGIIYQGNVLTVLPLMESESVQTCITSPPYWGLRSYCPNSVVIKSDAPNWVKDELEKLSIFPINQGSDIPEHLQQYFEPAELGLESTPEEYIAKMVQVFREVRRVLRKDGTLWLNLGDSYAGSWNAMSHDLNGKAKRAGNNDRPPQSFIKSKRRPRGSGRWGGGNLPSGNGLKPKDLCMMPARVALALQSDGWWLRSDIIWAKPGPMPESVKDRPSKSHEYIFLLTKSGKSLYWVHRDSPYNQGVYVKPEPDYRWLNDKTKIETKEEPPDWKTAVYIGDDGLEHKLWRRKNLWRGCDYYYDADAIKENGSWDPSDTKFPDGWDTGEGSHGTIHREGREKGKRSDKQRGHVRPHAGFNDRWDSMTKAEQCSEKRNKRSVWTVATKPVKESHFATFPPKLIEPCILAGAPEGGIVFDPFMGRGTTAFTAKRLGRQFSGIDLNRAYIDMGKRELAQEVLL